MEKTAILTYILLCIALLGVFIYVYAIGFSQTVHDFDSFVIYSFFYLVVVTILIIPVAWVASYVFAAISIVVGLLGGLLHWIFSKLTKN